MDHHPYPARRVLVVDDSEVQRAHAATLCLQAGVAEVLEAAGGEQALALLADQEVDVVIVDLEMPGMDGVELIEAMHRRGRLLPLVVVSSRQLTLIESVEAMAREIGMPVLGAQSKPLTRGAIASLLRRPRPAPRPPPVPAPALPALEDLRAAIHGGEIDVHFQPKVCLRTGLARGVEALARWRHALAGDVPATRFVELAESGGLIAELSFAVIDRALDCLAHWSSRGLRLSVAVNLSPALLRLPGLVAELAARVRARGLEPPQVVFEVTEGSVVDAHGGGIGVLTRLRLRGFGLSIDDFGTGYAAMSQLARIPFSELKIDRRFVDGASEHRSRRMLVESALETAKRFDLLSVAEGVENPADWQLLQRLGCGVAQGYLIARPMPAAALPGWLTRHQARLHELREPQPTFA